jgi:hypothetical protein
MKRNRFPNAVGVLEIQKKSDSLELTMAAEPLEREAGVLRNERRQRRRWKGRKEYCLKGHDGYLTRRSRRE